eukprot:gene12633-16939_t
MQESKTTTTETLIPEAAEEERLRRNQQAWNTLTGYKTSSGCSCWDNTPYLCIPKSSWGWGYNINFYALFCCCLCDNEKRSREA